MLTSDWRSLIRVCREYCSYHPVTTEDPQILGPKNSGPESSKNRIGSFVKQAVPGILRIVSWIEFTAPFTSWLQTLQSLKDNLRSLAAKFCLLATLNGAFISRRVFTCRPLFILAISNLQILESGSPMKRKVLQLGKHTLFPSADLSIAVFPKWISRSISAVQLSVLAQTLSPQRLCVYKNKTALHRASPIQPTDSGQTLGAFQKRRR